MIVQVTKERSKAKEVQVMRERRVSRERDEEAQMRGREKEVTKEVNQFKR